VGVRRDAKIRMECPMPQAFFIARDADMKAL
jgi:hypothetical protein